MDDDVTYDDAELAAAEQLDRTVTEILAGRAGSDADPLVLWLASSSHQTPPRALFARIGSQVPRAARPRRLVQVAAAALALLFAGHGVSSVLFADWVATNLGESGTHALYEGGLAMVAAAIAVGACLVRRSWTPISVVSGVPLGVGLGLHGLTEIGQFAAGVALHSLEGLAALALLAAWWADRRDRPPARAEGEV